MTISGENELFSLIFFLLLDDWNSYTVDNKMNDIAYQMGVIKWKLSKKIDEFMVYICNSM